MQRPPIRLTEGKHRILIISPQPWDSIQVSKHNYAKTLAAMGNTVYFLNPPNRKWTLPFVRSRAAESCNNVFVVDYSLGFPYWLKFKARWLYDLMVTPRAKAIFEHCKQPDVVWDFDNVARFGDLQMFRTTWRIFHPVDQLASDGKGDRGADLVLSVGTNILDKVKGGNAPRRFLQHGLGKAYLELGEKRLREIHDYSERLSNKKITVGYIGDLLSPSMDRKIVQTIVEAHPDIHFDFYGPYESGSLDKLPDVLEWLAFMKNAKNVKLHGRRSPEQIVAQTQDVDLWLVCYDFQRDINNCCNSHKILEYLATGKAVVSSRITAYDNTDLLNSPNEMGNAELPKIFAQTVQELSKHNSKAAMKKRIEFALGNSYEKHIETIQSLLLSC
jgi:glycosyltransferase involved in cell wall biosynthesis